MKAKQLFEKRNEVIHGRTYAGFDKHDYLKSSRKDILTRKVSSEELYQLANEFWDFRGNLIGPQIFRLPRAIQIYLNEKS